MNGSLQPKEARINTPTYNAKGAQSEKASKFKKNYVLVSVIFSWFLLLHLAGLYFFAKGFLLSRLIVPDQSSCDVLPDGSLLPDTFEGCWHPRKFSKAIIVVIDALRYDFTTPFTSLNGETAQHYHNNFPFMYDTASRHPGNAVLLPFIADPPTATTQRLQGLMAGNLPTFLDIGSSFSGQSTDEDNLLIQLSRQSKRVAQMGDDTWHKLFPGQFQDNMSYPYHSFNTKDLYTVDSGVKEHIFPLLEPDMVNNWDIIIAHFLGVDHAGHTYGPNHPEMAGKLREMNQFLEDLTIQLDSDTLLVVMGDHGMDTKGDHGGESDNEIESTIFLYSKEPRFGRVSLQDVEPPSTAKERPVAQIDLVSTLSLLLGLPVPFNNLGRPIPEAFITNTPAQREDFKVLSQVDMLVFDQMLRYRSKYMEFREFPISTNVWNLEQSLSSRTVSDEVQHLDFIEWHGKVVGTYRALWAKFDLKDMLIGLCLLLLSLFTVLISAYSPSILSEDRIWNAIKRLAMSAAFGVAVGLSRDATITSRGIVSIDGPLMFGSIGSVLGVLSNLVVDLWKPTSTSTRHRFWSVLAFSFTVSQAAGFASNSYTVHEDTILAFLLGTFGLCAFFSSLRQTTANDAILGAYQAVCFVLLTRAASFSRLCREEQIPQCQSTFYASQTSSTSSLWQTLLPYAIAVLLPTIIKMSYQRTASYNGSSGFWIGFSFRIGLLLTAVYWTIDATISERWLAETVSEDLMANAGLIVARLVFGIAIVVGGINFTFASPCVDISLIRPTVITSDAKPKPQVAILGYANTFGTRYFLLIPIVALCILVTLPPMGQYSIAICVLQILSLVEILDANGLTISGATKPYIGAVILAMLGSYHFFKTGHQAALSSIQWNAAYVPFKSLVLPWNIFPLLFNNFGAQILCATAVPLVVLWKRPVTKAGLTALWYDIMHACFGHILYYATLQVATTMWAGHLRRHLMLYRVFMPRFLMASGVLMIIDVMILLVALPAAGISALSVAEVFGY